VKLPLALTELGLIDEYEFVVHPRLAGHGPTLFAGLSKQVDLKLVSRLEFGSGAVAMAVRAEKVAIGLASPIRPHHGLCAWPPDLAYVKGIIAAAQANCDRSAAQNAGGQ
jgi:hypothetical protein